MYTNTDRQALPGRRGHRRRFDTRPVASPELDHAPWWADDANVDGCEAPLRQRLAPVSPCSPDYLPGETEHQYAQRLLREHGIGA